MADNDDPRKANHYDRDGRGPAKPTSYLKNPKGDSFNTNSFGTLARSAEGITHPGTFSESGATRGAQRDMKAGRFTDVAKPKRVKDSSRIGAFSNMKD